MVILSFGFIRSHQVRVECFVVVFELPLEGLFLPSKQLTNRITRQISQAKKRSKFTRNTAEKLQEGSKSL